MSGLTRKQYDALLTDLPSGRVASRSVSGRSLSYVEAWDIKRTLIRIFGFGGFSADVLSAEHVFTRDVTLGKADNPKPGFQVGYKVVMRLTVPTLGQATYTEAAVGFASLADLGEAHDMAIKTAESDALKRCAINLGTQFGLSLYNGGATKDVVVRTAVEPDGADLDEALAIEALPSDVVPEHAPETPQDAPGVAEAPVDHLTDDVALAETREAVLGVLRSLSIEEDASKRITAVAKIKAQYQGSPVLEGITMVGGKTLTIAALADNVAAGAYTKVAKA